MGSRDAYETDDGRELDTLARVPVLLGFSSLNFIESMRA
jgi:hypothetical protein